MREETCGEISGLRREQGKGGVGRRQKLTDGKGRGKEKSGTRSRRILIVLMHQFIEAFPVQDVDLVTRVRAQDT